MLTYLRSAIAILTIVALSHGCTRVKSPIYSYFYEVKDSKWCQTDEYFFPVAITHEVDTTAKYTVSGVIRIASDYALRTLPIGVVIEYPDHTFKTETVKIEAQDMRKDQQGYNCTEVSFVIADAEIFPHTGIYSFSYRHLLTDSIVSGVREIGIWIEQHP